MNHYYTVFQEDNFNHHSIQQWKEYGVKSFKNLMYHVGYPKEDQLNGFKIAHFGYHEFEKGDILQRLGDPCERFYFILQGSVKIISEREAVKTVFALMDEGNLASSYFDFFEETPSTYQIEACSRTRCVSLSKPEFINITKDLDQVSIGSMLMNLQSNFLRFTMWHQGLQSLPVEKRLDALINLYPSIIEKFRDIDIAQFLGVARETYSRMKSKYEIS